MQGQWLGTATGDTPGQVILDIDDDFDRLRGSARLFPDADEPGPVFDFATMDRAREQQLAAVPLHWMPKGEAIHLSHAQVSARFDGMQFPRTAEVQLRSTGDTVEASWQSDIGTSGNATLVKPDATIPSGVRVDTSIATWDDFKREAVKHEQRRLIFRGQSRPWRLRTAFHRTGRKDLIRYAAQDIPAVHRELTARTRHVFDIGDGSQLGAFMNLIQHHGYPTPLLDWTYSPFVAAFFAYRYSDAPRQPGDKVRIYRFDKHAWATAFNQLQLINFVTPHFSILEAFAIENPRAMPQQSLSTLTNVDDIESFITSIEVAYDTKFLSAIDLPAEERGQVLYELSYMGITAGALFPGLDGACEELTARMFKRRSL